MYTLHPGMGREACACVWIHPGMIQACVCNNVNIVLKIQYTGLVLVWRLPVAGVGWKHRLVSSCVSCEKRSFSHLLIIRLSNVKRKDSPPFLYGGNTFFPAPSLQCELTTFTCSVSGTSFYIFLPTHPTCVSLSTYIYHHLVFLHPVLGHKQQ